MEVRKVTSPLSHGSGVTLPLQVTEAKAAPVGVKSNTKKRISRKNW
jgi:hypothetical protein